MPIISSIIFSMIGSYLNDKNIKPCKGCESCKELIDRYCVNNDDMTVLYTKFIEADVAVFASPVYWWSISSQLKLFVDRLYALIWEDKKVCFASKRIVVILTFGDSEPCSGADLTVKMFEEIFRYTVMKIAGIIRYSSGGRHVSECPGKLNEAYEMGFRMK
jgi:multimeric flavodoxin WrbA